MTRNPASSPTRPSASFSRATSSGALSQTPAIWAGHVRALGLGRSATTNGASQRSRSACQSTSIDRPSMSRPPMNHANPLMGIPKTRLPLKIYQSSASSPGAARHAARDRPAGMRKWASGRASPGALANRVRASPRTRRRWDRATPHHQEGQGRAFPGRLSLVDLRELHRSRRGVDTGGTGGTTQRGLVLLGCDLKSAYRYVRFDWAPDLSAASNTASMIASGDARRLRPPGVADHRRLLQCDATLCDAGRHLNPSGAYAVPRIARTLGHASRPLSVMSARSGGGTYLNMAS